MNDSVYARPEHDELRRQVARFVATEVEPHALAWDEAGSTPREVLRKMGSLGWLCLMVPARYGGAEADMTTNVAFQEALSRSTSGGFIITVLVHTDMASPHLAHGGSDSQKARWLPRIVAGELVTAIAVSEPDAGSDVAAIRTRAVREGGEWVLNGTRCSSPMACSLIWFSSRPHRADRQRGRREFRSSPSNAALRVSASAAP